MTKTIGQKLKAFRKTNKLTMKVLAVRLGVDESTISYYESGKKLPGYEVCRKIKNELGINPF